jgi:hypothetical protein
VTRGQAIILAFVASCYARPAVAAQSIGGTELLRPPSARRASLAPPIIIEQDD